MDPYQLLTERFTLDNKPLLLSATFSFAIGYLQYVYAIRLTLREGKGPIPFWMHQFYLAHDSTWAYLLNGAASRHDEHWFLRGTSTALLLWTCLEVFCIHRSVFKDRETTFSSLLGPNSSSRSVLQYTILMQLGMYSIVVLLILLIGEGCLMQWFCLTNVLIVIGPIHEYLRRGSRQGLSLGFCLVNVACVVWTFTPFSFWVLSIPEIFDQRAYYTIGLILGLCSIWAYLIVARYPPKTPRKDGKAPIW
ncbi:hypothetical protein BKA67DRAFT_620170 [Truncatella angustata]|uniref:Uncharacterized protein n=1 Tax=Truncatella angustata TaxID=152316 RepID=A0A9P8UU17_9PEZI|nr:uncharacterized protein BKA67DRAFT_620170 [Truncatella angustata]KAH6658072.1 hypothetical protein BKA67DRAFT_620170 [Truncatella angustata]